MEMNTRLQVEHPVTEIVSDVDIVTSQFDIAARRSISAIEPKEIGYAIEARVNAEKAVVDANGDVSFEPHPGEITECVFPEDDRVDIITMAATGKQIPPYYDSMIAQIIAKGKDRDDCRRKTAQLSPIRKNLRDLHQHPTGLPGPSGRGLPSWRLRHALSAGILQAH